jgi:hypothetical protein
MVKDYSYFHSKIYSSYSKITKEENEVLAWWQELWMSSYPTWVRVAEAHGVLSRAKTHAREVSPV